MAPASVQVVCMEPVVFLRGQSAVGEDARGRRRQIDFEAAPSQLRGLVNLSLPRSSRIKEISITLVGKSRTDWPEGIGPNRLDTTEESTIFQQKVVLYTARETGTLSAKSMSRASSTNGNNDWVREAAANANLNGNNRTLLNEANGGKMTPPLHAHSPGHSPLGPPLSPSEDPNNHGKEFPKGVHSYPFSIPLPSNLPPTLHADFGSTSYTIRAYVHRAGALTPNLTGETEVTLVHAPDEDGSEEVESIVVERNWEDSLRYMIVVMGKSFPVGGRIPIWCKFVPMEKVRIHRILASLEERTAYYAKGRRVARHEVPRRWTLLKILPVAPTPTFKTTTPAPTTGILPILSEHPNAILESPLAPMACAAAAAYSNPTGTQAGEEEAKAQALASLGEPTGPWEFTMDLEIPRCSETRINISSNHMKSNIAVHHIVKLSIRVEKVDTNASTEGPGQAPRKLYDILIEAPISINHSRTANAWLTLPDYWSVPPAPTSPPPGLSAVEAASSVPPPPPPSSSISSTATGSTRSATQAPPTPSPSSSKSKLAQTFKRSDARLEVERKILRNALQSVRNSVPTPTTSSNGAFVAPNPAMRQDPSASGSGSSKSILPNLKEKHKQKQSNTSSAEEETAKRLAWLSQQWLSLTAEAGQGNVHINGPTGAAASLGMHTFPQAPQSQQTTYTYGGPYFGDVPTPSTDLASPPTYDMIDGARGSIDLPPEQRTRADGK